MHRDIKPANMILARERLRFLLVDLGAAVDLGSGTNYKPDESLLDPAFCPPEQVSGAAGGRGMAAVTHICLACSALAATGVGCLGASLCRSRLRWQ